LDGLEAENQPSKMNAFRLLHRIALYSVAVPVLLSLQGLPERRPMPLIVPLKPGGIYELGERAGWTLLKPNEGPLPVSYRYLVKKNNSAIIKEGVLDLTSPQAVIEVKVDEPAMLYCEIRPATTGTEFRSRPIICGAVVAPTKLKPVVPLPRDFDSFWKSKIKALNAIPMNPELTPKESGNPGVEYATIKMDHINSTHVYGQIAKPKGPGKFPAMVMFQWASPPYPLR